MSDKSYNVPDWLIPSFPAGRTRLAAVSIVPTADFHEFDLLSRAPAVYLVCRRLAAAVLSFPYPWFDFPVIIFTLLMTFTNLRSAGQPTEKAVSRSVLFSLNYSKS